MAEAPDYKRTVNLPTTGFPMKANLPQREPGVLEKWATDRIYERLLEKNLESGETFVLHDGPPYANNHIHQGHMLNKVLKDIVGKFRSMEGKAVRFIPGWDCHGLPIELQVDKKLGAKKREMSRNEIRDACRAYATEWIDIQREEFKRLGIFADWENPYLTMSFDYEAAVVRELARFAERGGLYRGKKPVYWCIFDRTALAEAEVEYADHTSPSVFVGFDVVAGLDEKAPALVGEKVQVAIWTTTPWTLPANLAVAVHPEFKYVVYRLGDRHVVVAEDLLIPFLAEVAPAEVKGGELVDHGRVVATFEGRELEGIRYQHPFLDRQSQIILGDHVTLEQGTGLVHTAPGHGQEDYQVGLKYGLEVLNPVDDGGFLTELAGERLQGKRVFDANPEVIAILEESGHLFSQKQIEHSYPHCWRCSKPVIFRGTDQWFISMEANDIRREALEEIDKVRWIPKWGRDRIHGMIENRPDWCISRQRVWGSPITVLYCDGCDEALVDAEVMEKAASFIEKEGGNAWFARPAEDFLPEGKKCPSCGGGSFHKEEDILDVWFDSGVSFAAVLEGKEGLGVPADLYLEGSDQHRGWFHSSLLCSVGTRDHAPYKAVLTHGFVVDGEGRKISKRLGNYVDPLKLIQQYGAEIMRLWVASEDYRNDIRTSAGIFQQLGEGYFKIRNTIRYCLSNLFDFDPAKDLVPTSELPELERWALHELAWFNKRVRKAYDDYEFHMAYKSALDFCVVDMSAVYLDIRKDLLYCNGADSRERRATQTVLYTVVKDLLRLLAPVLSFTAEEAWSHLPGEKEESVFFAGLPVPGNEDPALGAHFEKILELRGAVSKHLEVARREKRIGKNLDARVVLHAEGEWLSFLRQIEGRLPTVLIVSQVEIVEGAGAGLPAEGIPGVTVSIETPNGAKCVRCWTWSDHLGTNPDHPELCPRCTAAVVG